MHVASQHMQKGISLDSLYKVCMPIYNGFLSQNMLLRHENVQIEVQLPKHERIVAIGSLYSLLLVPCICI